MQRTQRERKPKAILCFKDENPLWVKKKANTEEEVLAEDIGSYSEAKAEEIFAELEKKAEECLRTGGC